MLRLGLVLFLLSAAPCNAQNEQARFTLFGEILGNTGIASLNFDMVSDQGYGFRIGGLIDPTFALACSDRDYACQRERRNDGGAVSFATLVVMAQRLVGEHRHNLEYGLGLLVLHAEPGVLDALPPAALTATLGYRLQPEVGRLGLRVGLTPIIAPDRVLLRPGFSISYGLPTPD